MVKASEKYSDVISGEELAERGGYSEFFRKYYPNLLFYATRFLDREQAEDVVQDAFMDLWYRRSQIDTGANIVSFMYRSVYTRAINKIKHASVVNTYSAAAQDIYLKRLAFLSPDNNEVLRLIESEELRAEIYSAIDSLPDKCRETFKLSYLHDLKNREIADIMGISVKTVEAHMYKALKLLRLRLGHLFIFLVFMFLN